MVPYISVIVPVYNGEYTLANCLRALKAQNLQDSEFEIIVVADGCTDSSIRIAKSFDIQLLEEKRRRGAPAARNVGLRSALGEWVAFTDCDCIPTRGWLKNLLHCVNDDNESTLGAAGLTLGYESNSSVARFVDLIGGHDAKRHLSHPNFPFAPSANVMYRRSSLKMVHGFDERYSHYDACDLHYRLLQVNSGRFYFEPKAIVLHRHRKTWPDYFYQQFGYGRGLGEFMLHHRVQWSMWREIDEWRKLMILGLNACRLGDNDEALIRRGKFVKQFAQRLGFVNTYWNRNERQRW